MSALKSPTQEHNKSTMRAFRIETFGGSLEHKEVPVPEPGPEQVLIRIEAAGLCHSDCHSDCHIISGFLDHLIPKSPLTLGHQVAGTIAKLGSKVSRHFSDKRVAAALIGYPICHGDWSKAIRLGYDGGYSEFAIVDLANICDIPDGVTTAQAAIETYSIATAYHVVVAETAVDSSSMVTIIGLGGLGLNGVAIAALQGAEVYGIDVDTTKFSAALKSGAKACYSSLDQISNVTIDVVIDFAGMGITTANAIRAVKRGGTVVQVGLGTSEAQIPMYDLVSNRVHLRGSFGASLEELREVLGLITQDHITPTLEEIHFLDVPRGLLRLESHQVNGRLFTNSSLPS